MLDGRDWSDIFTTVSGFNEVSGINRALESYPEVQHLQEFDITKVGRVYIPLGENNLTYKNVEEERYTSGYFILSDGVNVQIRVCDGMFIPIFTSVTDDKVLIGVRIHLMDKVIELQIDTCSPFGEDSGYYQKIMRPMISSFEDQLPPEEYQKLKEVFDSKFADGYNKYYPLVDNSQHNA